MDWPDGFEYRTAFITGEEEAALAAAIGEIQFASFEMRGVVARRRVAFFGSAYDARREVAGPIPAFLAPLRSRVAEWADLSPDAFAMALVNEYPPGAPIGWHRDAPQYDIVAGVSLLSPCTMKFRPYVSPDARTEPGQRRTATHAVVLIPRSAYLMRGDARERFEHHIPPATRLRYSITFRTLRTKRRGSRKRSDASAPTAQPVTECQ